MKIRPDLAMARLFQMDEAAWRRHANPLSVYTRFTVLPLLLVALWSRVWFGFWAISLVLLALVWAWWNPRLFAVPASTKSWASKAVLGERVWLNRKEIAIPAQHRRAAFLLSLVTASGLPFLIVGVWQLSLWPTLFGVLLVMLGKLWFLDRMVWLFDEMERLSPVYQGWHYGPLDIETTGVEKRRKR